MIRRALRGPCRGGFTLVEIVVTGVLITASMTVLAQSLLHVAANRRLVERRAMSLSEVGNVMERLAAADWSTGTPGWAEAPALSDEARRLFPRGTLAISVTTPESDASARRVEVVLKTGDDQASPARLVAWLHPQGGRP